MNPQPLSSMLPQVSAKIGAAALLLICAAANAVLFQSTSDPGFNTTAPTGALAGSGWELQGSWGSFLGTPIAPGYFIAAKHVGGSVGDIFTYQGADYSTVAYYDDPGTDLRIWQIDGRFPAYAGLYSSTNEVGRDMVVFGRGTQRGDQITSAIVSTNYVTNTVDIRTLGLTAKQARALYPGATFKGSLMTTVNSVVATNTILNGWTWGVADGVMRWGTQKSYGVQGSIMTAVFAASADPNFCALSGGDSSGAIFIHDGTSWKLAGINYAVDGPVQENPAGPLLNAALLDKSGLYQDGYYVSPSGGAKPGAFYSTRISTRLPWIQSVISQ